MTMTARDRNMRRILIVFALICLLLTAYLYWQAQDLARGLQALARDAVERDPYTLRKQLRRTRVLTWAALGATVLLVVSAAAAGRRKKPPEP